MVCSARVARALCKHTHRNSDVLWNHTDGTVHSQLGAFTEYNILRLQCDNRSIQLFFIKEIIYHFSHMHHKHYEQYMQVEECWKILT